MKGSIYARPIQISTQARAYAYHHSSEHPHGVGDYYGVTKDVLEWNKLRAITNRNNDILDL